MDKQVSLSGLSDELAQVRTKKKGFLSQIERIVPWGEWLTLIRPCYYKGERGNKPYDLERMLRIYLLQNLYDLADEATVAEIIDSRAFSEFCGVDSSNQVPDGDTLGRFRNLLIRNGLQEKLFRQAVELLQRRGLILKKGTIVDSTIIAAPSSTKNQGKQRDPDAHQMKKGNTWHFGYKAHVGVDKDTGLVHTVEVTGANTYLLAMVSAYWVTIIVLFFGCKAWKDIVLPARIQKQYVKEMLTYSIPLMPNSISWWISNSSDRYIMNIFRGLNELGIYSVSYKIPSIMATISAILISAWEMSAVDDFGSEKSRRFFSKIYDLWVHTYIIVCAGLIFFVKVLAYILFQKEFFIAWKFVPILLFASVFSGLSSFLGTVFTAAKNTKSVFVTTMAGAGINIALNFVLIPVWGGYGAAVATAIGYLTTFFARLVGANRIIKFEVDYKKHFIKMGLLFFMVVLSCLDSVFNYVLGITILFIEREFIVNIIKSTLEKFLKRKV